MNRLVTVLLLVLLNSVVYAQADYSTIDKIALNVQGTDVESLHKQLTSKVATDELKLRAFYIYITKNIQYDIPESKRAEKNQQKQEPLQVIKSGKAICHGYSALLMEFCRLSGIPVHLVSGYTKHRGEFISEGHTWNVVYVNGNWRPIDATWGAGGLDNEGRYIREFSSDYFLTDPVLFLSDHYPFDPMWQLVNYPVKLKEYKITHWAYSSKQGEYFNFNDTIAAWVLLDSIDRDYHSSLRMVRFNPGDPIIKEHLAFSTFEKGNSEFHKGNVLLQQIFPSVQTTYRNSALENSAKLAVLDSVDNYYERAEKYYSVVQLKNSSDRMVLQNNLKALQYNRETVKKAKNLINNR